MKVSIVLATYNGEDFIETQLNSIKNQSRPADEVIIHDDCSSDNTSQIVNNYIKKNKLKSWKFEVNEKNIGYKSNFLNLLKVATGDVIFLSDQDDEWQSNKVELMIKVMQENPELDSLNSAIQLIDQNSRTVNLTAKPNFYNANFLYSKKPLDRLTLFNWSKIIERNISPGCSMCITKKLQNQFIELYDFSLPHDWFLNLLASITDGCGFLNEPLIRYRVHPKNTLGLTEDPGSIGKMKKFEEIRQEKIKEFTGLIVAFTRITDYFNFQGKDKQHIKKYLYARLEFYKKQNLLNLLKLRSFPEYFATATFKGRIWDIIMACHLKKVFYRLVKF